MSDDLPERVREEMGKAARRGPGEDQVAHATEAVRLADLHGDLDLAYEARFNYLDAVTFSGYPDRALVAFTWCLGHADKDPERFAHFDLLWKYKWIANALYRFPRISAEQIRRTLDDFETRFLKEGYSLRPVHQIRCMDALARGQMEIAQEQYRRFVETRRDPMADCRSCEESCSIEALTAFGRDKEALKVAAPLLAGRMQCSEEPHIALSRSFLPHLRLGRIADYPPHHLKAVRLCGTNLDLFQFLGRQLEFLAISDNLSAGVRLLERQIPNYLTTPVPWVRYHFLLGARVLAERLAEMPKKAVRIRLPREFPLQAVDHRLDPVVLRDWIDHTVREIAAQFDARNGNASMTERIREHLDLLKFRTPVPLKPKKSDA